MSLPTLAITPRYSIACLSRVILISLLVLAGSPEEGWAKPSPQAPSGTGHAVSTKPVSLIGKASWYGPGFHGRKTASGERFNPDRLTAAHRHLPLGTKVLVTNLKTGKKVTVTINDRGPYVQGCSIALSRAAAKQLGVEQDGIALVRIEARAYPRAAPRPQATPGTRRAVSTRPVNLIGKASWYGPGFHGRRTAGGQRFNQHHLTAAHRRLPLGTRVIVTNLSNGRKVRVTINDRGPYVKGISIDLSRAAAKRLGMEQDGIALVRMQARPHPQ